MTRPDPKFKPGDRVAVFAQNKKGLFDRAPYVVVPEATVTGREYHVQGEIIHLEGQSYKFSLSGWYYDVDSDPATFHESCLRPLFPDDYKDTETEKEKELFDA